MTKTVSARIPNKTHQELCEMCNKSGCTINEWLCAAIDYIMIGSSEFDFGDEEHNEFDGEQKETSEIEKPKVVLVD